MYRQEKFLGFTLAEVLITLGIIGVVAALTIPTLISNYQKNMYLNRFKKSYSMVLNGFRNYLAPSFCSTNECSQISDYFATAVTDGDTADIDEVFNSSFKVSRICKGENELELCASKSYEGLNGSEATIGVENPYAVAFTDGSSLNVLGGVFGALLIVLDTNGSQKPNKFGYDAFVLVMDISTVKFKDFPVIFPYGSTFAGDSWGGSWKDSPNMCGRPGEKVTASDNAEGFGCAARIIEEGYKITYF